MKFSPMVERVARFNYKHAREVWLSRQERNAERLYDQEDGFPLDHPLYGMPTWEALADTRKNKWLLDAFSSVCAMQLTTEEMNSAGAASLHREPLGNPYHNRAANCFAAMIKEALKTEG